MGSSRQEHWDGFPFPTPGDLPDPGVEPRSPTLWVDFLPAEPPGKLIYPVEQYKSDMKLATHTYSFLSLPRK